MDRVEALTRFAESPVARLATMRPDGWPHIVPVTFVVTDDTIVTVVDHKPKTTTRLQRLANVEAEPRVAMLADHYSGEWSRLWWVRVDGRAAVLEHATDDWLDQLAGKYPQYREKPPRGPALAVSVTRVTGWSAE